MTPDEVVTRARELVGQRVRLTNSGGNPVSDLVDIQPAPMRIKAGQLYGAEDGRLFKGDAHGALWEMVDEVSASVDELPSLHPVKVVPA